MAIAELKSPPFIPHPIRTLRFAIEESTRKLGPPTIGAHNDHRCALMFGPDDDVRFVIGFQVYEFRNGQKHDTFPLRQLDGFMRDYYAAFGTLADGTMLDWLAWWSEHYHSSTVKRTEYRARREYLRQYERRFATGTRWTAALVRETRHAALNALYAEHFNDVTAQIYAGAM